MVFENLHEWMKVTHTFDTLGATSSFELLIAFYFVPITKRKESLPHICVMYANASSMLLFGASSHRVPCPTHVRESQHGGKVPTFEPQDTIKIFIKVGSWFFYEKLFVGLVLRIGPSFCSIQLSTQVPSPHLQKCCHVGIHVILGS